MGTLGERWAKYWMLAKEKAIDELSRAETQTRWKAKATHPNVVKKRNENLKKAIEAGRIEAGLSQVDPAEWGAQTAAGIKDKTITSHEKARFEKNAEPYITFVQKKSQELLETGLTGKEAWDWWWKNVIEKLKEMKEKGPEKVVEVAKA